MLSDCINLEYKKQGKKLFGNLVKFPFISKKIIPLYTGVSDFEKKTGKNIRNELSLSHNDILIIMASNIVSGKGQIDLIKSMEILLRESSRIHLLVAGTAVLSSNDSVNYFESLKHVALQNNLNKHVHFIGWRSDIRDILALSDIYVSTSYSESFPDAVREAMLESLPVVVTDVGGTCELVDEGCNGFLFQPGEIEVLTEHLKKIINNSDLRKDMGKNSLQIIKERFSTKVYAENFEVMVENLS